MKPRKLLLKIWRGNLNGIAFADFARLIRAFGFEPKRQRGSHQIWSHPVCDEDLNLQPWDGEAKPYQVRQFLKLIDRYNLLMQEDDE